MIWGKTGVQKQFAAATAKAKKKAQSGIWCKRFAWHPVWLTDGRTLWLGQYERRIDYEWSNSGREYATIQQRTCL